MVFKRASLGRRIIGLLMATSLVVGIGAFAIARDRMQANWPLKNSDQSLHVQPSHTKDTPAEPTPTKPCCGAESPSFDAENASAPESSILAAAPMPQGGVATDALPTTTVKVYCKTGNKCCMTAGGSVNEDPVSGKPTAVYLGVNKTCADTPTAANGSPNAGFVGGVLVDITPPPAPPTPTPISVIANSPLPAGAPAKYVFAFPQSGECCVDDPKCSNPDPSVTIPVTIWVYYNDGSRVCMQKRVNPTNLCGATIGGCPSCP